MLAPANNPGYGIGAVSSLRRCEIQEMPVRKTFQLVAMLLIAAVHSVRADTPTLGYWDNWTDTAGISHLTRCMLHHFALGSVSGHATPEWQDRQPMPAGIVQANIEPTGWDGGWHENPAVQWIVPLQGRWGVQAMDGTRIVVGPGEVIVGEDQGSHRDAAGHLGHLSWNAGSGPVSLLVVQMPGVDRFPAPCRFQ